ncbi:spore coat protein [Candidatus Roizmanbacteria bacterium CG_4_9_14_0_2_um_filter_39_13]|uniref:glucose-1-phosphate thymidylyltransferase n=2 Tax=Candidatus Roizmaniibacteriota TaxID=1752723 RepID=A0A2M8F1P4_9BACT|nr:MAG: spore coat protein [Candidatus Roizmanbacteria bacterium CG_4_9_14_0_2_um_filter_39_13]PJE62061.1 MAG: spore coat protein [Candidatus Roizmanbacteria bacterium CG10_big_fil_rev_8_21_14_0_10_39_12]
MKGIILAGGRATRLRPLTKITSKQLLPVYDKPMIFHPIETLTQAGIQDILIIIAPEYAGQFLNLLGTGSDFGAKFTYEIQEEPRGLADAFIIGEHFIGNDNVTMILGDNIFDENFSSVVQNFQSGGHVFAKKVQDPQRYAVIEFDEHQNVLSIMEKPQIPKSDYAMVGLYILDNRASKFAKNVKPSARDEIEIPDVINQYLPSGELKVTTLSGIWEDAGTFDSLLKVNNYWAEKARDSNK